MRLTFELRGNTDWQVVSTSKKLVFLWKAKKPPIGSKFPHIRKNNISYLGNEANLYKACSIHYVSRANYSIKVYIYEK